MLRKVGHQNGTNICCAGRAINALIEDRMLAPLSSSRRKIQRAKLHVTDFADQISSFLRDNPPELIVDPDPYDVELVSHKLRFRGGIPSALIDAASDALHSLRSALDNATYGLAVAAGEANPRYAYFPFAGSGDELENSIRELSNLSNADKHRLLRINVGSQLGNIVGTGGVITLLLNPMWDRDRNEIEIGTFVRGSGINYSAEIAFFIAFDGSETLIDEPTLRVLDYWANKVDGILLALEAESKRLGIIK